MCLRTNSVYFHKLIRLSYLCSLGELYSTYIKFKRIFRPYDDRKEPSDNINDIFRPSDKTLGGNIDYKFVSSIAQS